MSTPLIILVSIGVIIVLLLLWLVVATILRDRQLANLPPRPPFVCPSCKSEQIEVLSSGLWDGADRTHGIFDLGVCKQCGSRCGRLEDDQPFVPSNEQWQSHFAPREKLDRERKSWPFDSNNEDRVA